MNDRFKFRCWDKQIKKMRYGDIQLSCSGLPFILEATSEGLKVVDIDNIEIMQCTGLRDNTDKLIFEGDIVKFSSIYGHGIFKIKWSDELSTFGYEDDETDFSELGRLYQEAAYVEVIGNIYMDSHLLDISNNL